MMESWRWFGPLDRITLPEIMQTGASGIVTALHDIPYGEVWPEQAIAARSAEIAATGRLQWVVVESLPVDERIKRGEGDLSVDARTAGWLAFLKIGQLLCEVCNATKVGACMVKHQHLPCQNEEARGKRRVLCVEPGR